jgi:DNA-binding response OmpR family regulator
MSPRFCCHVPASSAALDSPALETDALKLLIVDDDALICAAYQEILRGRGYDVFTAGSRAEALREIDVLDATVDVLVLDIGLPDADGAQLAQEIVDRIGSRPTLYVSGWADEFWNLSDAPGRWLVMQKPIPVPKLIAAIDFLAGRDAMIPD